jgi:hypothetical protein
MLRAISESEFDRYIDFAYELALDLTRSGYPTYTDGIKTKADYIEHSKRSLADERDGILLYERDGKVCGWIQYFTEPEEKYMQTDAFNIESGTREALHEFIAFARERFPGFDLHLGFPEENTEAVSTLEALGFERIEESYNNALDYETYEIRPEDEHVVEITRENYPLFAALHTQDEDYMYWTAKRILAKLDDWKIFAYIEGGKALGAVYFRSFPELSEIFGIDFEGDVYRGDMFRILLASALNYDKKHGAKHMVFFCEDQEQPDAIAAGFRLVGKYVCYKAKL